MWAVNTRIEPHLIEFSLNCEQEKNVPEIRPLLFDPLLSGYVDMFDTY